MFGKEREDKINLANYAVTTIVGSDTTVEGTIITKSSVRIDGTLIGGVSAEGVVILTKQGKIHGNIMAENIIVAGVVEGNMQIREKVDVEPSGEIYGDITTKKLLIDEESIFQGNCYMNRDKQAEISKRKEQAEEIRFGEDEEGSEADKKKGERKSLFEKAVSVGKKEIEKNVSKTDKSRAEEDENEESSDIEAEAENSDADLEDADLEDGEIDDIDFLDVNVKKNRNNTSDNKRRRN